MQASDFAGLMPDCCNEVLDSMYFTTVLETVREERLAEVDPGAYCFTLKFCGEMSGWFGLRVNGPGALSMAANFLGEEESDLSAVEVEEVIGELANMLCGSVVSRLKSEGKFSLSHPQVMTMVPDFTGRDASVLRLDTDAGSMETWVAIDKTVGGV